jgi:hypothetical protein
MSFDEKGGKGAQFGARYDVCYGPQPARYERFR